jgi:hypothetical protein
MIQHIMPLLFADASAIVHAGDHFRQGQSSFAWQGVAVIAAVAAGITLLIWIAKSWADSRQRQNANSPLRLFRDLCSVHQLDHRQRRLLSRMAKQLRLEQPATLFIEPALWQVERLGSDWTAAMPQLDRLRKQLFSPR